MIKVLIADDHGLIRQGVKAFLAMDQSIQITGEAEDGASVFPLVKAYAPDVVLMDVNMPGMTGLDVLLQLKANAPWVKVILLTVESDKKTLVKAIEIGADGYVLKGSSPKDLLESIYTVMRGDNYIDKALVSLLFQKVSHAPQKAKGAFDELTERECDILKCLAKGMNNQEIASTLFLSEKTVKNNCTRIFKKLEVKDRVQATIYALENDILKKD